jgi:multiple sugar transport system permease protein
VATATKHFDASSPVNTAPHYSKQLQKFAIGSLLLLFTLILLSAFLLPFGNMAIMSLKSYGQLSSTAGGPVLPVVNSTFHYQDADYNMYTVPMPDGTTKQLALVTPTRAVSKFIDPANVSAGLISWPGNWRGLDPVYVLAPAWDNYPTAWNMINFPRLFGNTMFIAVAGLIGTLLSSICVAYAFARFPIPGKNILFIILIATIILPGQVTLIPTYVFFSKIGWAQGWAPLIIPHFFANAYNVFLLRQYFMTLPRALDEAAMIDGANPLQILIRVIIPQSWPAIISVALFHFIFAWNDFFNPLIYLASKPELQPISVGVQQFNYTYGSRPELVQATSLMGLILPVVIFFFAQRVFMRGVVITGVEK